MLFPFYLDLLDIILPLAVAAVALASGRYLHRLNPYAFRTIVAIVVLSILLLGASSFLPFPEPINDALWHIGGEAIIAAVLGALLLGVVWSVPGRSMSNGFLFSLIGMVALVLVLNSGGRLWWRTVGRETWQNSANAEGGLRQTEAWTCAPASAAMLLHQFGIKATEGEMAYLANSFYMGTDIRSIAHGLTLKGQPHGLRAKVVFANYEASLGLAPPFVSFLDIPNLGGHAVLILRLGTQDVDLIDPRFGQIKTIPRSVMEPQWQGKLVQLERVK